MNAESADVEWLLHDLSSKLGYGMALRDLDHFVELAHQGAEAFADAVLLAEGLDPTTDGQLRRDVREYVAERFASWAARGPDAH